MRRSVKSYAMCILLIAITTIFNYMVWLKQTVAVYPVRIDNFNEYTQVRTAHGVENNEVSEPVPLHAVQRMTLVSEYNTTKHIWPWGGQILNKQCRKRDWYASGLLPNVSVIITFFDQEQVSTLLRTVHSIIQRTPAQLLHEIILVEDDCSRDDFHETLDIYISSVFGSKVKVLRSNDLKLGLIKARLIGIRAASAPVVVCMDSHMEVQQSWLEPLLYEIKLNRQTLASSVLDWIEYEGNRWTYKHGGNTWKTYFDLNFVFGFQTMSQKQEVKRKDYESFESPVIVGTIWAMDKQYFTDVGEFDEGMKLWGGENLDLPLRVWLFGGRVVNVPCSHAAHLEKQNYRAYRDNWAPTIQYNYKRFVEVWFDDRYKSDFYTYFSDVKNVDVGDLSDRLVLKSKAKHNFEWFLNNVFPELAWPSINNLAVGQISNKDTGQCIINWGFNLRLGECVETDKENIFFWTTQLEIRQPIYVFSLKQDANNAKSFDPVLEKQEYISMYQMNATSLWFHVESGPLMTSYKGEWYCLTPGPHDTLSASKDCDMSLARNRWQFQTYTQQYYDVVSGHAKHGAFKELAKLSNIVNNS